MVGRDMISEALPPDFLLDVDKTVLLQQMSSQSLKSTPCKQERIW